MVQQDIEIIYKHYIPNEWIDEFSKEIVDTGVGIKRSRDDEKISFFTGPEIADIIIFIKGNPESIFIAPALYDILKSSILTIWRKLRELDLKKIKSYKTANSQRKEISIRYRDSKGELIKINIEGELDVKEVEEVVSKSLKVLRKD
ncbi:MAG: hypothetical protein RJQ00_07180 [Vicingaceae bacterium]